MYPSSGHWCRHLSQVASIDPQICYGMIWSFSVDIYKAHIFSVFRIIFSANRTIKMVKRKLDARMVQT